MVKKIKRFIVFCLFSLIFSLFSGKITKDANKSKDETGWNSVEAKCCPAGSTGLDENGDCY